jgi:hypothetical protein
LASYFLLIILRNFCASLSMRYPSLATPFKWSTWFSNSLIYSFFLSLARLADYLFFYSFRAFLSTQYANIYFPSELSWSFSWMRYCLLIEGAIDFPFILKQIFLWYFDEGVNLMNIDILLILFFYLFSWFLHLSLWHHFIKNKLLKILLAPYYRLLRGWVLSIIIHFSILTFNLVRNIDKDSITALYPYEMRLVNAAANL